VANLVLLDVENSELSPVMGGWMFLVFCLFALAFVAFVFWVWGLVDAAKRPDEAWTVTGQSKVLWILFMVVGGAIVTLVYVFWPRPLLNQYPGYPAGANQSS
jgi:hypothetical protein